MIFVGIALILWFTLGSITIVIILSLIVHEHRVSFHLLMSLSSFSLFFFPSVRLAMSVLLSLQRISFWLDDNL